MEQIVAVLVALILRLVPGSSCRTRTEGKESNSVALSLLSLPWLCWLKSRESQSVRSTSCPFNHVRHVRSHWQYRLTLYCAIHKKLQLRDGVRKRNPNSNSIIGNSLASSLIVVVHKSGVSSSTSSLFSYTDLRSNVGFSSEIMYEPCTMRACGISSSRNVGGRLARGISIASLSS